MCAMVEIFAVCPSWDLDTQSECDPGKRCYLICLAQQMLRNFEAMTSLRAMAPLFRICLMFLISVLKYVLYCYLVVILEFVIFLWCRA
jgi:hypothetical protein